MRPADAVLDSRYLLLTDSVLDGDHALQSGIGADVIDLCLGQPGSGIVFATLERTSTFGLSVPVVVAFGPEEQVLDVEARGVVATVQDAHLCRDFAVSLDPGQAMGHPSLAFDSASSVAEVVAVASPLDAWHVHDSTVLGGV